MSESVLPNETSPGTRAESRGVFRIWLFVAFSMFLMHAIETLYGTVARFFTVSFFYDIPWSLMWAGFQFRGVLWMTAIPLLALVIVSKRPLWQVLLMHTILFTVIGVVVVSVVLPVKISPRSMTVELSYGSGSDTRLLEINNTLDPRIQSGVPADVQEYWISFFSYFNSLVVYLLTACVGYSVYFFVQRERSLRDSMAVQKSLDRMRHEALCNRLQPHFLHNALNSIVALISKDPQAAEASVVQLSSVLRHSIDVMPEQQTDLETELELLKSYLEIQKLRFGPRLEYSIEYEDSLVDMLLPPFLLQPIVENSFQHGFRKKTGLCSLRIKVSKQDENCRIDIVDNGTKLEDTFCLEEGNGVGLTRERLQIQYKDLASLSFEPNQPVGVKAVFILPLVFLDSSHDW